MVDALNTDLFARVQENIHEDHHYKFKVYQKEGATLKDTKDQQQWTVLHHYLHLSTVVDMNVVNMLVKDQGIDLMAEGNQKHNAVIVAAKNPKCTQATLNALAEMGVPLESQCETGATVLMYYVRYNEDQSEDCVKWLMSKGIDVKHADKN